MSQIILKSCFFVIFISFNFSSLAKTINEIIATVNNQVILQSDLDELKTNIKKGILFDLEYASLFDLKKIKNDEKLQLEYLINEQLFINYAKKTDVYSTSKKSIDKEILKIAKANQLTLAQFKNEISKQGVSFEDYKVFMLKSLVRKKIIDREISSKVEISESDIIQYLLQNNSNAFKPQYEYTLSHIVVDTEEDTSKVMKVLESRSFNDALTYSENPENNGFLGKFKEAELAKAIKETVQKLKISEVSPPIPMNGKIFFIKLDDKKRVNELPDTPDVRRARMALVQENLSSEIKAWIEEKRQHSHIINKKS